MIYAFFYRLVMRVAHRFNWHYAPPTYPEGDTHLWCQWCGFRQTIKYSSNKNRLTLPEAKEAAIKAVLDAEKRRYR